MVGSSLHASLRRCHPPQASGAGIHTPMDLEKESSFIFYSTKHLFLLKTHSNCITDNVGLFFSSLKTVCPVNLTWKGSSKWLVLNLLTFGFTHNFHGFLLWGKLGILICPLHCSLLQLPAFILKQPQSLLAYIKPLKYWKEEAEAPAAGGVFWLLVLM